MKMVTMQRLIAERCPMSGTTKPDRQMARNTQNRDSQNCDAHQKLYSNGQFTRQLIPLVRVLASVPMVLLLKQNPDLAISD